MRTREVYRGIPRVTMVEYLQELGGVDRGDIIAGPGWRASLAVREDRVGSLEIPVLTLSIEGRKRSVEALLERLAMKTFRAGG